MSGQIAFSYVCQSGGWGTCVSAGWLGYMCVSRVAGVARGMVCRHMHFPHVDGRQIVP